MTPRWIGTVVAVVALLIVLIIGVTRGLERLFAPAATQPAATTTPAAAAPEVRHITATLFYASADGEALEGVRREVPLEEGTVAQGRQILSAQLDAAPEGRLSVIPAGTTLRAFYVTGRGDAFVDLSAELSANHPGGSSLELLTVAAIVNAVTANLPAVQRVQILIDGKEVDTLAGHVDLRRPLERDASLIRTP
jgi:spore germination protein GerM